MTRIPINANFNNRKVIIMLRRFNFISLPIMLALLAGCSSVGRDFVEPDGIASERYRHSTSSSVDAALPSDWWTVFGDATLNRLEERAFRDNPGLKVSGQRLVQAQALLSSTKAAQMPMINANASMQKLRSSLNTQQSIVFGRQLIYGNNFTVGASMSYEVDLWGRVQHMVEAAEAQLQSAEYDHVGVALLLSTQVANLYWQLRGATIEQQILETALETRKETRVLVEARFQAGFSNELDVARTHVEEANTEAELNELLRQRNLLEHGLATLIGASASQPLDDALGAPLPTPPRVPVGLPAQLLSHRPDLASSVASLRSANAQVSIAEAAFYPSLQLTSDFGYASRNLRQLFDADSRQFNSGPLALTLPIFDGGRNRANLTVAKARYQEALANHQDKLLNALREVEDALSDNEQRERQANAQRRAQKAAEHAYRVSLARYERGFSNYLDVIDAQRNNLATDRAAVQIHTQRLLASVAVVRALGGGWQVKAGEAIAQTKFEQERSGNDDSRPDR